MVKRSYSKRGTALWRIGLWATIWWAVSGLYLVLWVWMAKAYYVERPDWLAALGTAYDNSAILQSLWIVIVAVWFAGGLWWLRELKRQRISYAVAFKDLFLTIHR